MATVIFSHGFGVRADSRGMFTDIATAMPEHTFVMFDYNRLLDNGDTEVNSLENQAAILQNVIDAQTGEVIIVAHSQGCIITGMINQEKVAKIILLAPPAAMSMQHVLDKLANRPGAVINPTGTSMLPRKDGTTTHITKDYLDSINKTNPMEIYKSIAGSVTTTIVRCTEDEIVGLTDVNTIPEAKHIDIAADHNFTGPWRPRLIKLLAAELAD